MIKSKFLFSFLSIAVFTILVEGNESLTNVNQPVAQPVEATTSTTTPPTTVESNLESLVANKQINRLLLTKSQDSYKVGDKLSFDVDTNGRVGYLYIFAIDDNGEVTILQPNALSPLTELKGKYTFPKDFTNNNFEILAEKHCTHCKKEKTTVYAFLTKIPIANLNKISDETFVTLAKGSEQEKVLTKGFGISTKKKKNKNLAIGKMEFTIE